MESFTNKLESVATSFTCAVSSGPLNLTVIVADGSVKVLGTVQYGKVEREEVLLSFEAGETTALLRIREGLDQLSVANLHAAVVTAATIFLNGEPVRDADGTPLLRGLTPPQLKAFNDKVSVRSGLTF